MQTFIKFLISFLASKTVRDLLIHCAELLAERTDNKFDDACVKAVKDIAAKMDGCAQ